MGMHPNITAVSYMQDLCITSIISVQLACLCLHNFMSKTKKQEETEAYLSRIKLKEIFQVILLSYIPIASWYHNYRLVYY